MNFAKYIVARIWRNLIFNNIDFYLVSDVNRLINTFLVLQNVKYLKNCLDKTYRFLARWE